MTIDEQFIPVQLAKDGSNISVACAVTLYEAYRQKNNAGHYDAIKLQGERLEGLRAEWGFLEE